MVGRPMLREHGKALAAELATGGGDVVASWGADVSDDVSGAEGFGEGGDALRRWTGVRRAAHAWADRVVRDQVHVGAEVLHERGEGAGVGVRVVHISQQAILDRDDPAGAGLEALGGGEDFVNSITAVHGNELG